MEVHLSAIAEIVGVAILEQRVRAGIHHGIVEAAVIGLNPIEQAVVVTVWIERVSSVAMALTKVPELSSGAIEQAVIVGVCILWFFTVAQWSRLTDMSESGSSPVSSMCGSSPVGNLVAVLHGVHIGIGVERVWRRCPSHR